MKTTEIRKASEAELHKIVADQRDKLRDFRLSLRGEVPGNIREARTIRRTIARALTELNERHSDKAVKDKKDKESK